MKTVKEYLAEKLKNTYEVGDKVNTPFGVGTILKHLETTRKDMFFLVKTKKEGDVRMGTFEFQGHAK